MEIKRDMAQIYSGCPVKIQNCNIAMTQPTIKDICVFGEDNFLNGIQVFTSIDNVVAPIKEGNTQLSFLENFQILLIAIDQDIMLKNCISMFFDLVFPDYIIRFDPGSISFLIEGEKKIVGQINPMNFEFFKETLRFVFLPSGFQTEQEYKPANEAAARIAEKLKKGNITRQQMAVEKGKESSSFFVEYISILSIGLNIPIKFLFEYTPFQLYNAFTRYTHKMAYDFYQKIATTPMMDASQIKEPTHWMDSFY